jgi:hypothetical protein
MGRIAEPRSLDTLDGLPSICGEQMKYITPINIYFYGKIALTSSKLRLGLFWPLAEYVWANSAFVSRMAVGPFPREPMALQLVARATTMPDATSKFIKLLNGNSRNQIAYSMIGLKALNRLTPALISGVLSRGNGKIKIANGCFRTEIDLQTFAQGLMRNAQ